MDKEDTLTKTESAMAAYQKTFKAFCFLCDDGVYLVAKCPHLSKAQVYIKEKMAKARSTSRNRKKSRRHYHSSSDFKISISSLESTDSEVEKKKKKKPEKKPKKDKKNGYAHAAVSNSDSDNDDTYLIKVYGAMSDGSDVDDEDVHGYIATAKN